MRALTHSACCEGCALVHLQFESDARLWDLSVSEASPCIYLQREQFQTAIYRCVRSTTTEQPSNCEHHLHTLQYLVSSAAEHKCISRPKLAAALQINCRPDDGRISAQKSIGEH